MSNASLISRIELALDRYERGEIPAFEVEQSTVLNLPAMDGIVTADRHEAGRLYVRLINADLLTLPMVYEGQVLSFEGGEPVSVVLQDFRTFLARLRRS